MYVELPEYKRCCMCLPLRHGLLAWGYFKLLITIVLLLLLTAATVSSGTPSIILSSLIFFAGTMEVVFNIVFVVGAHMKNEKLMGVYFYYSIVGIILFSILALCNMAFVIYIIVTYRGHYVGAFYIVLMSGTTAMLFLQIVLQFYLIMMVRSEIRKLRNGHQFEFANLAAEAVCKLKTDNETNLPELIANMD